MSDSDNNDAIPEVDSNGPSQNIWSRISRGEVFPLHRSKIKDTTIADLITGIKLGIWRIKIAIRITIEKESGSEKVNRKFRAAQELTETYARFFASDEVQTDHILAGFSDDEIRDLYCRICTDIMVRTDSGESGQRLVCC